MSISERLYFYLKTPNQNLHDRVRDNYLRKAGKPEVYKKTIEEEKFRRGKPITSLEI
jgi:hypothetical protein